MDDLGKLVQNADNDVRYVPGDGPSNEFCGIAHETRYEWILENYNIRGKRIIDMGCGSGYGTSELAKQADFVVGIDYSATATGYAAQRFRMANLKFLALDATDSTIVSQLGGKSFDMIVSFDVIEHVERYFDFLLNAWKLVKPNGVVAIGTPNRAETFARRLPWNPYHFQEFSSYQLKRILSLYFGRVRMVAQTIPDEKKRESVRSAPTDAPDPAHHAATPFRRLLRAAYRVLHRYIPITKRRFAKKPIESGQQECLLGKSDISFETTEDPEILRLCFGLVAICTLPREAPNL